MAKKDYSQWSKEELIREVKKIAKEKKYVYEYEKCAERIIENAKFWKECFENRLKK